MVVSPEKFELSNKKNCVILDKNNKSVEIFFEFTDDQIRTRKGVLADWGKILMGFISSG